MWIACSTVALMITTLRRVCDESMRSILLKAVPSAMSKLHRSE